MATMRTARNFDYFISKETSEEKQARENRLEIADLKHKLTATDYIAAKIAEGAATREEYADRLAERAAWRARINELEQL